MAFGTDTVLGSDNNVNIGRAWLAKYTAPQSGALSQMSFYTHGDAGTTGTMKMYVYADDGTGDHPVAKLASTAGITMVGADAASWRTQAISLVVTSGTVYWLGAGITGGTSAMHAYWGAVTGSRLGANDDDTDPAATWALIAADSGLSVYAEFAPITPSVAWLRA
jgi:hypothetical protein